MIEYWRVRRKPGNRRRYKGYEVVTYEEGFPEVLNRDFMSFESAAAFAKAANELANYGGANHDRN